MSAFTDRWEKHFDAEPWWQSIAYVHAHVHDWDGPEATAIEAMVYDLAQARGIPTVAVCRSCKREYDEIACFECAACTRKYDWRVAMVTVGTAAVTAGTAADIFLYLDGLIKRNVQ